MKNFEKIDTVQKSWQTLLSRPQQWFHKLYYLFLLKLQIVNDKTKLIISDEKPNSMVQY